jgi:hypothetical protein
MALVCGGVCLIKKKKKQRRIYKGINYDIQAQNI